MGKSKRFNVYDEPQANRRKVVQSYGAQRQRLSINSSFRGMPLEPPIVNAESFITGTGTGTFASASLSADQTTNIAATNHVEFDTLDEDGGVVLQTGAGQADGIFELGGARKYYLSASLRPEFSGVTGQLVVAWFDITNAAEIGRRAIYESQTNTSNNANQPSAEVTITPAANITVEVRIISVTALTALANEYCVANLFEIALGGVGGAGGGGTSGVTFPITPDINDHGNVGTVTEDIDIGASTGHVHKLTLTGNPTLTFSNPPSSGTQMEFEIEFVQDATGGRTVTFPASVVETVTISPAANSTTIVTFRTNDGGTTYHGIPALRGSISLAGGSTFASTALDNLVSPVINAEIDFNTFDVKNVDRVRFTSDSGAPTSAGDPSIFLDATSNMVANVATSKSFVVTVNNSATVPFSVSATSVISITHVPLNSSQTLGTNPVPWVNGFITNLKDSTLDSTNTLSGTVVDGSLAFATDIRQTFNPGGTVAGLNVGQQAGDPSTLVNGDIWYDSTGNKFRRFQNGSAGDLSLGDTIIDGNTSVVVLDSGPSATTTINGTQAFTVGDTRTDWNSNHDLFGAASFSFFDTVDAATATVLTQNQTDFTMNFPVNTDVYQIEFNSVLGLSVDLLRTRLFSNTPNTISAALSLFRDDASPTADDVVGDINFDGRDSAANFTTYADIIGVIADPTSTSEDGRVRIRTLVAGTLRNSLTVEGPVTTIHNTSSVAGDVAELDLVKIDASPQNNDSIGEIKFQIEDTGVTTTYGSLSVSATDITDAGAVVLNVRSNNGLIAGMSVQGDDNNQRIMILIGGTDQARIQPLLGQMGHFVTTQATDFSLNIGTSGSLEIPVFSDGSPSVTDLNQAFGAFDGAMGYDSNDGKLYIRETATVWSFYSRSGTVT